MGANYKDILPAFRSWYDRTASGVVGKRYYCLIAGLADFGLDATEGGLNWRELRAEIRDEVTGGDRRAVELLYMYYDIDNLIGTIRGTNLPFNELGTLSQQQICAEIRHREAVVLGRGHHDSTEFYDASDYYDESDGEVSGEITAEWADKFSVSGTSGESGESGGVGRFVSRLPGAMALLLDRYVYLAFRDKLPQGGGVGASDDLDAMLETDAANFADVDNLANLANSSGSAMSVEHLERELYQAYYAMCEQSGSAFLRRWSAVDRMTRNVVAVSVARELGLNAMGMVIGNSRFERLLLADYGSDVYNMSGEVNHDLVDIFPLMGAVQEVLSITDFVEREHKMDDLRWRVIDALNEKQYFSIDVLLGYLVKLNIVYRWLALDKEFGRQRFNVIVDELKTVKAEGATATKATL